MTITNLFRQLRQGLIPESKFLYEARRDSNLPWILNTTSFKDAVQILKNKGIITENDQFSAPNEDKIIFSVNNGELDDMLNSKFSSQLDHVQDKGDTHYSLPSSEFSRFEDLAMSSGFDVDTDIDQDPMGKESMQYAMDEAKDANDSVLMKMRAKQEADKKAKEAKSSAKDNKNAAKIKALKDKRDQLMHDMEQEAEAEGGKVADEYGDKLDDIDKALAKLNESYRNEDTYAIIDTLNPYVFKKALEFELAKLKEINDEIYAATCSKVAKKLQKDPKAYIDVQFPNAKDIAKYDSNMKMLVVKKDNHKDANRQMQTVKAFKDAIANTKDSKAENKKGKPQGVKELSMNAKKAKGISKAFETPSAKEKIMEAFYAEIFKKKDKLNEDMHPAFGHGEEVPLQQLDREHFGCNTGIIRGINGGTLEIELDVMDELGQPIVIHRQVNAIEDAKNADTDLKGDVVTEPVMGKSGEFRSGDLVNYNDGSQAVIKGFKKVGDDIHALVNENDSPYHKNISVHTLTHVETDPNETDDEYRKRVFGKMNSLGSVKGADKTPTEKWLSTGMSKEDKLKEVINKLKKFAKKAKSKEMDEVVAAKTGDTATDNATIASINKIPGQGKNDLMNAFKSGKSVNIPGNK
jgi:hypothetical protein